MWLIASNISGLLPQTVIPNKNNEGSKGIPIVGQRKQTIKRLFKDVYHDIVQSWLIFLEQLTA